MGFGRGQPGGARGEEPTAVDEESGAFAELKADAEAVHLPARDHQRPAQDRQPMVPQVNGHAAPLLAIHEERDAVGDHIAEEDLHGSRAALGC